MKYSDFLDRLINQGLSAARRDYARDEPKLRGAVAGFEDCRGKHPGDLALMVVEARQRQQDTRDKSTRGLVPLAEYWRVRCYCAEVEWVCNVVAAAFDVRSLREKIELPQPFVEWRQPPVPITSRGQMMAMNLLNL